MPSPAEIIQALGGRTKLTSALQSNLDWIYQSFKVNGYHGSSGSRTVLGRWAAPYPETTGYLIPTLLLGDKYLPKHGLADIAKKQLSFFKTIRTDEGSYYSDTAKASPIVFDVAQILLGHIALVPHLEHPDTLLQEIEITKDWLSDLLDEEGIIISHNYVDNFQPSYYSRIAWPLAFAENIIDSKVSLRTKKLVENIVSLRNENSSFKNWGFHKGAAAYTHTIAYTLRGLWEYAELVNSQKIKNQVKTTLKTISKLIKENNKVAATYDEQWNGDSSYICSAGNAQLALMLLITYERTSRLEYLDTVTTLLKPLLKGQRKFSLNKGAVPSSLPIWGNYQKMKFTNWTQKFFADALMKLLELGES